MKVLSHSFYKFGTGLDRGGPVIGRVVENSLLLLSTIWLKLVE